MKYIFSNNYLGLLKHFILIGKNNTFYSKYINICTQVNTNKATFKGRTHLNHTPWRGCEPTIFCSDHYHCAKPPPGQRLPWHSLDIGMYRARYAWGGGGAWESTLGLWPAAPAVLGSVKTQRPQLVTTAWKTRSIIEGDKRHFSSRPRWPLG
jgi:hypothetical protein